MTFQSLTWGILGLAIVFIIYDVWTNRRAERLARDKEFQMIDNFELIQEMKTWKE